MTFPILIAAGVTRPRAAAFIAVAAFFGMVAPPVNICAMLIGGGVDMPYSGFGIPLSIASFPLAFASSFWLLRGRLASLRVVAKTQIVAAKSAGAFMHLLPLIVFIALLSGEKWFPEIVPAFGVPLLFVIAGLLALITGKRVNVAQSLDTSIRDSIPILALLAGVGMFIQVLTLTGARGLIVVDTLIMPHWLRDIASAVLVPVFGGVSAYGASSVLGVPLLLAMLDRSDIIVAAALSLLASIGDFLPPTRLAVVLAAQVSAEERPNTILRHCWLPAIAAAMLALLMIWFANPLAKLLHLA
jgi:TRAP-type C4-dicarboxylate transport system permease large subunit